MLHIRNFTIMFLTGFVAALPVDTRPSGGLGAICSTVNLSGLVGKLTGGVGGLTRGILGDYRAPKAAGGGGLFRNVFSGASLLVDSILGRPETACSPATPIPIPVPGLILTSRVNNTD
ncbi:hypothetical protein BJ165DRAFT_1480463 [Panaeolus papilionaceus]|nr:hypothetical protein BJ165DRAFT_1480463 [Panaeolus papilionaceus]